jgi:hypothetical protein
MTNQLFAAALGIAAPWFVQTVDFDAGQRRLTIHVDFVPGSRFAHAKAEGEHVLGIASPARSDLVIHPAGSRATTGFALGALPFDITTGFVDQFPARARRWAPPLPRRPRSGPWRPVQTGQAP